MERCADAHAPNTSAFNAINAHEFDIVTRNTIIQMVPDDVNNVKVQIDRAVLCTTVQPMHQWQYDRDYTSR